MNKTLKEISQLLESHIENHDAEVYTFVETGLDETGTVATSDGYLRLAKELIDFVVATQSGEGRTLRLSEVEGYADSSIGSVFSSISEVELDSTFLVKTKGEAETVTRYFQQLSPQGDN